MIRGGSASHTVWMTAFPNVRGPEQPMSLARPLSCRAEARISEAEAVRESTSTYSGVVTSRPSAYLK
jgi:hypothetical protein